MKKTLSFLLVFTFAIPQALAETKSCSQILADDFDNHRRTGYDEADSFAKYEMMMVAGSIGGGIAGGVHAGRTETGNKQDDDDHATNWIIGGGLIGFGVSVGGILLYDWLRHTRPQNKRSDRIDELNAHLAMEETRFVSEIRDERPIPPTEIQSILLEGDKTGAICPGGKMKNRGELKKYVLKAASERLAENSSNRYLNPNSPLLKGLKFDAPAAPALQAPAPIPEPEVSQ